MDYNTKIWQIILVAVALIAIVRSGIVPPDSCTVTKDELQGLIDAINDFDVSNSGKYIEINETASTQDESCSDMINTLQTGINELSNIYQKLRDETISNDEYEAMKRKYEEKIRDINKQFDDLLRAAEATSKDEIDRLIKRVQDLQANLNSILDALEKERAEHRETKIQLCIVDIGLGKFEDSANLYQELNDSSLMERILTEALNGKFENGCPCVYFLDKLWNKNPTDADMGISLLSEMMIKIIIGGGYTVDPQRYVCEWFSNQSNVNILYEKEIAEKLNTQQ